jgi:predicted dehydrogenase
MKQLIKVKKEYKILEVPSPQCNDNEVLIRNSYSLFLGNVEKNILKTGGNSLIKKVLTQPSLLNMALTKVKNDGIIKTIKLGKAITSGWHIAGCMTTGTITKIGKNVKGFKIGDAVIASGWKQANHAQIIAMPQTQIAKVESEKISPITVYAGKIFNLLEYINIEDKGIQTTGSTIGNKILHKILANIETKHNRIKNDIVFSFHEEIDIEEIDTILQNTTKETQFYLITEQDNKELEKILQKRVKLHKIRFFLKDKEMQKKENPYLELNQEAVDKIKEIDLGIQLEQIKFNKTPSLYTDLKKDRIITYNAQEESKETFKINENTKPSNKLGIALIGAGNIAHTTHIPIIQDNKNLFIKYLLTKRGWSTKGIATHYQIPIATSNYTKILEDPEIDIIMILTHHDSHANYAIQAIQAGKQVFIEKPIAITEEDCKKIEEVLKENPVTVNIGFNKIHSPLTNKAKEIFKERKMPLLINYRMQSQMNKTKGWCYDEKEGGGRLIGEHSTTIYYLREFVNSPIINIQINPLNSANPLLFKDANFSLALNFEDGSVANMICSEDGSKKGSKERIEFIAENNFVSIDNWEEITINGNTTKSKPQKGFVEQWNTFIKRIENKDTNNNIEEINNAMHFSFKAKKQLNENSEQS